MQLPTEVINALVYYGDYQSYIDPLGSPCQCVTCDKGSRAQEALAALENAALAASLDPEPQNKYAREYADAALTLVRAALGFYATGAAYAMASRAYGEGGNLSRYVIDSMMVTASELEQYAMDEPYITREMVEAAAETMPWTRAESVLGG